MSYRRVVVVNVDTVMANAQSLVEQLGSRRVAVSTSRRSNLRFLTDGAEILTRCGIEVIDRVDPDCYEIALHDLLGGHPSALDAVALESHVYGIRDIATGDGVSYGATYIAPSPRRVALAPIGFADGLDRKLSGIMRVRVDGVDVPVIGRIAMDSISCDVTDVEGVSLGSVVTVYGDERDSGFAISDAADALGTSRAEIITRLSERAEVEWR